ncbi:hypothetical protein [Porphyromonas crevioricanis]|nr:hypothetical protein [Porphyromonas crevioricanis]GAD04647.1 hypothetical protein PORCRE_337 [Porphyromonas crevioricanis JCM 15906]GAD07196.1 hypothetical protein PORCAN_815 [Porphyromonas crevioricanis JCM 13913]
MKQENCRRMRFKHYRWEVLLTIVIWVVFIILLATAAFDQSIWITILIALSLLSLGYFALLMPLCVEDYADRIVVKRVGWPLMFQKDEVKIEPIPPFNSVWSCVRLFGSAGFMGFTGLFANSKYGRFWMYAVNLDELVMITDKKGHKTVINYRIENPATSQEE